MSQHAQRMAATVNENITVTQNRHTEILTTRADFKLKLCRLNQLRDIHNEYQFFDM
jgi:hypothetical protein